MKGEEPWLRCEPGEDPVNPLPLLSPSAKPNKLYFPSNRWRKDHSQFL
jgi:hypothetical protein